ncbi:exported protein of unknown function [Candidatus Filomicrobium marinum]|uniref:Uncharacterized protein n=2 Tax=Filomicrobium TaxID=119044 RepID=A0A0D6JDJ4_9HYPH|nr:MULTISPECIES: hypothetical protein [Filomicrobium]CFX12107.1 exported protein of unknown function [Candidatus Filomicrobium marinum]CPR17393.1 exported protein of unknown function [Candidatus Filomicrobium marinum]SDO34760.1 hypothetical protein SAMN04488061_0956 [Filomicrobium insigne]
MIRFGFKSAAVAVIALMAAISSAKAQGVIINDTYYDSDTIYDYGRDTPRDPPTTGQGDVANVPPAGTGYSGYVEYPAPLPGTRVYGWVSRGPAPGCGEYQYWNGSRCLDARVDPPNPGVAD